MKNYLIFLFLSINFSIPAWGDTNKPLQPPQTRATQETKKSSVSKSSPANKKNKKQENKTLIVKTALKQFILTYNKNKVAIKGHQLDLSLDRKKCNAHIITRFNKEITQIIRDALKKKEMKSTIKKKEIDTVEIQIAGKSYFTQFSSQIGQTFLYFPKEILRMKWEEKFNCQKKTKKNKQSTSKKKKN